MFKLSILTDDYPEETTWTLQDECNVGIVAQGGPFDEKGVDIVFSKLLPKSKYTLTIADAANDGICCGYGQGAYSVEWDGAMVQAGGEFSNTESVSFGECSGEIDKTGSLEVLITTDQFPEETSWKVLDMCDGRKNIFSGGQYENPSSDYQASAVLPPSQYKFVIRDSASDGIYSEAYGYGSYSVYWEGGLVKQGGEFGLKESTVFGNASC